MKQALLGVLQFFVFLLLVPVIIATTLGFQNQVLGLPVPKEQWFLWGVLAFVVLYLFLYNFKEVYEFGQSIIAKAFQFFEPLAHVGSLIIPLYTVLTVCAYLILNIMGVTVKYEGPLLLALGFSAAMHLVLTAHQLYDADGGPIKGQYLMGFGFAGIANLLIIALLLGFAIHEFSFVKFVQFSWSHASSSYQAIYRALF